MSRRRGISGLALGAVLLLASHAILAADASEVQRGHAAFEHICAACHGPDLHEGRLLPGTQSLSVKYHGVRPAALEQRTDLTAPYVTYIIRHGSYGMPFFRKTEVSDADMQAIAAYSL
jgi:mono/diheme cytochrome c family protein